MLPLRLLRRTIVRPVVILVTLVVILVTLYTSFLMNSEESRLGGSLAGDHVRKPFEWTSGQDKGSLENACRNTIQGAKVVTDELGYTCRREMVDPSTGCCLLLNTTSLHSCQGCQEHSSCCNSYEYCVSCCLRPEKASLLGVFLNKAKSLLYSSVSDTFELCLARCRTSSMSVVHENAYIDEVFKYCHGANEKPLAFMSTGDEEE